MLLGLPLLAEDPVRNIVPIPDNKEPNCGAYFRQEGETIVFRFEGADANTAAPVSVFTKIEVSKATTKPALRSQKLNDLVTLYTALLSPAQKTETKCLSKVYAVDKDVEYK
jgi:hypothetical protein